LEPNAGPIGGAGLAWPPLHCSFTKPVISFAIFLRFIGSNDRSLREYSVSQIHPFLPFRLIPWNHGNGGQWKNLRGRKYRAELPIGEL